MADVVNQALGIDLILERILELSDFSKLKELRMVNYHWNKIARCLLRKTAKIELRGQQKWSEYERFDATLVNRDITAGVPIDATIDYQEEQGEFRITEFIPNAQWRLNIEELEILFVTINDANRLMPFLLSQLRGLKALRFRIMDMDGKNVVENFEPPVLAPDDVFPSLKLVGYTHDFCEEVPRFRTTLDAMFLRHSPKLETLIFIDYNDEYMVRLFVAVDLFLGLFRSWKRIVQENPVALPHIQKLIFNFSRKRKTDTTDALVEFINFNKPTTLQLSQEYEQMFPKIDRWTPAINFLMISVPFVAGTEELGADLLLRLLKRFEVFAQLSKICLLMPTEGDYDNETGSIYLSQLQIQGPVKHQLGNVEILVVKPYQPQQARSYPKELDGSLIEQAALQMSNVSRLELDMGYLHNFECDPYVYEDYYGERIFKACKSFPGLRKLSLDLLGSVSNFEWRENEIMKGESNGYFHTLILFKDLETLEVNLKFYHGKLRKETILVALFHGYEPRVKLDLSFHDYEYGSWTKTEVKLSVDGFKQALKDAECALGIKPSG